MGRGRVQRGREAGARETSRLLDAGRVAGAAVRLRVPADLRGLQPPPALPAPPRAGALGSIGDRVAGEEKSRRREEGRQRGPQASARAAGVPRQEGSRARRDRRGGLDGACQVEPPRGDRVGRDLGKVELRYCVPDALRCRRPGPQGGGRGAHRRGPDAAAAGAASSSSAAAAGPSARSTRRRRATRRPRRTSSRSASGAARRRRRRRRLSSSPSTSTTRRPSGRRSSRRRRTRPTRRSTSRRLCEAGWGPLCLHAE